MYICIYLHLLHHYVSHMPFVYYNYYVYNNNAVCLHGMCAPHRLPASHVQTVCIIYYTVRVCSNKLTVDVIAVIHISGELIVSKYVAESITMIAGRFGHEGLCQLRTELKKLQCEIGYIANTGQWCCVMLSGCIVRNVRWLLYLASLSLQFFSL